MKRRNIKEVKGYGFGSKFFDYVSRMEKEHEQLWEKQQSLILQRESNWGAGSFSSLTAKESS